MTRFDYFTLAVRFILSILLLNGVFYETGFYTTAFAVLVLVHIEMTTWFLKMTGAFQRLKDQT
jgi:hypothetical protein